MTIQAVNAEKSEVAGFFGIGAGSLSNSTSYHFDILGPMEGELEEAVGSAFSENIWNITWAITLITSSPLINASRYSSALPSYNLGVITNQYFGASTGNEFWNFLAQTFRANAFLMVTGYNPSYPISGYPDYFPGTININSVLPFTGFRTFEYATSADILLQSAESSNSYGYANYRAQALEGYNPFISSGF